MPELFEVTSEENRLDIFLKDKLPHYSRGSIQRAIKSGSVLVDGSPAVKSQVVHVGERVSIEMSHTAEQSLQPCDMPIPVVFENSDVLVVNKPSGVVCHPGAGISTGTLIQGLLHHHPEVAAIPRAGLIHRIDKGTSGLLLIAKSLESHAFYSNAMRTRTIARRYRGIVFGQVISGGTINKPLIRSHRNRLKRQVAMAGKDAITHFSVRQRFSAASELDFILETGRNHQIRAHLEAQGMRLIGDSLYGKSTGAPKGTSAAIRCALTEFTRPALHAWQLAFPPFQKKPEVSGSLLIEVEVPPPEDYLQLLAILKT